MGIACPRALPRGPPASRDPRPREHPGDLQAVEDLGR